MAGGVRVVGGGSVDRLRSKRASSFSGSRRSVLRLALVLLAVAGLSGCLHFNKEQDARLRHSGDCSSFSNWNCNYFYGGYRLYVVNGAGNTREVRARLTHQGVSDGIGVDSIRLQVQVKRLPQSSLGGITGDDGASVRSAECKGRTPGGTCSATHVTSYTAAQIRCRYYSRSSAYWRITTTTWRTLHVCD